ncbi:MAG: hypothetical protein BMS9Abin24_230 [Thermodesulfobacteriota bacterium]|nr:MAG: hypothetical protein BMS9Abin24_230 [Thermodesulfobacteriota bacterium]
MVLAALFFSFFLLSRADLSLDRWPAYAAEFSAPVDTQGIRGLIPGFPVNINTATAQELTMLPGVGSAIARRILDKRVALGGFASVEQLTEVKWVGKVKLERLRGLVTVK